MIYTFCNQKGGSGKTTLTLLTAMALESIGQRVAIIDRDPQRTSTRAIENLASRDLTSIELASNAEGYDSVFIDTAPRLDKALGRSIAEADRVILTASPSPADLWSTQESREFVESHLNADAKCALLFNSVVRASKVSRDLEQLAEAIGLPALKNYLSRRQAFQYAVLKGWDNLKPAERDEIKTITLEINSL